MEGRGQGDLSVVAGWRMGGQSSKPSMRAVILIVGCQHRMDSSVFARVSDPALHPQCRCSASLAPLEVARV